MTAALYVPGPAGDGLPGNITPPRTPVPLGSLHASYKTHARQRGMVTKL